jgi:phosphoglycolate phosphatase-like HAD superfamily hydrolase
LRVDQSICHSILEAYIQSSANHSHLMREFPGISELLNMLAKMDVLVSVVTSKPRPRAVKVLESVIPDCLQYILITPEDVPSGRGKPNPDPILFACCQLGVDPHQTIYVGDMDVDRQAAGRSGTHFVHACWGYEQLSARNEVWFSSASELGKYLVELIA